MHMRANAILLLFFVCSAISQGDVRLPGVFHDLHKWHDDANPENLGLDVGIVETLLGTDNTPTYAHSGGTRSTNGPSSFQSWFHETSGVSTRIEKDLTWEYQSSTGNYRVETVFGSEITNLGYGNEGYSHNHYYTFSGSGYVTYHTGATITVQVDGDAWIFMNDRLVIDWGGVRTYKTITRNGNDVVPFTVNLDDFAYEAWLEDGCDCKFNVFMANRNYDNYGLILETNMQPSVEEVKRCPPPPTCEVPSDCGEDTDCNWWECYNYRCKGHYSEIGTLCDDLNPITCEDYCDGIGNCVGDPCNECTDVEDCTDPLPECYFYEKCEHGICKTKRVSDGTPCDDSNPDNCDDKCKDGDCSGSTCPECFVLEDCTDPLPSCLFYEKCYHGVCVVKDVSDGTPCNDSDPSTCEDKCKDGVCLGSACPECTVLEDCIDPLPQCMFYEKCYHDMCVVKNKPDHTPCNDNDPLTCDDECNNEGVCSGWPCPQECDVLEDCTNPLPPCYYWEKCYHNLCVAKYLPESTPCEDGDPTTCCDECNKYGVCLPGRPCPPECQTPADCGDPEECWQFMCDAGHCTPYAEPVGTLCNDNNPDTSNDRCNSQGNCVGECPPDDCTSPQDCGPAPECHMYLCDAGECLLIPLGVFTPCNDGNPDTTDDQCDGQGRCSGECPTECDVPEDCGPPHECLEHNCVDHHCTTNNLPHGTPCDDFNSDTNQDTCDGQGHCVGECPTQCTLPTDCGHFTDCRWWDCVNELCVVILAEPGVICDDGNPETDGETCDGIGRCRDGECPDECETWADCPPEMECAKFICPDGQCILSYQPIDWPCDDGNPSTTGDHCDGQGNCEAGECPPSECDVAADCGPLHDCLTTDCVDHQCVHTFIPPGIQCDDGNLDTINEVCDGFGHCVGFCPLLFCNQPEDCGPSHECLSHNCTNHTCTPFSLPRGTPCDDFNPNTINEVCDGLGYCVGFCADCHQCDIDNDCGPSHECLSHYCINHTCVSQNSPPGIPCDDFNPDTENEVCDGQGFCIGFCPVLFCNIPADCGHLHECLTHDCIDHQCVPQHHAPGTPCDDGNTATENDQCDGNGKCIGSCPSQYCDVPEDCGPGHECLTHDCVAHECIPQNEPSGTPCDDLNPNTDNEVCDGQGHCVGFCSDCHQCEVDGDCGPSHECIIHQCINFTCVPQNVARGTPCDDHNAHTEDEVCDGHGYCFGFCPLLFCIQPEDCGPVHQCVGHNCSNNTCVPFPLPRGTLCNDNNGMTDLDACDGDGHCIGACPVGCETAEDCGPIHECIVHSCILNQCTSSPKPPGAVCDDLNEDTDDDKCDGQGHCGGTCPTQCDILEDCGDAPECNLWICPDNLCILMPMRSGTECDDGSDGTTGETCNGQGQCTGGECQTQCQVPLDCGNSTACRGWGCVDELCRPRYSPVGTPCDDGNPDTEGDRCDGMGHCLAGDCPEYCETSDDCDYAPICNIWICDDGTCTLVPDFFGQPCDDGSSETTGETCDGQGHCTGGECPDQCETAGDCGPPPECNYYTCNQQPPGSGVHVCILRHTGSGVACDDGSMETDGETCDGQGHCTGGDCPEQCETSADCGIPPACRRFRCAPPGFCVLSLVPSGWECDDGNPDSFEDICDAQGHCFGECRTQCLVPEDCGDFTDCRGWACVDQLCRPRYTPQGTLCNDSNPDTEGDHCDGSGRCLAGDCPFMCEIDADCGAAPECNEFVCTNGFCILAPIPYNTSCDDGNPDSFGSVCDGQGFCGGGDCPERCQTVDDCGLPPQCNYYRCRMGFCDLQPFLVGAPCDDGNSKTHGDHCDGQGSCAAGDCLVMCTIVADCGASPQCNHFQCRSGFCVLISDSSGTVCDDGNDVTDGDMCDGLGNCKAGDCPSHCNTTDDCGLTTECRTYTCEEGLCYAVLSLPGTPCDDGNPQTTGESCDAHGRCRDGDCPSRCNSSDTCGPAPQCNYYNCRSGFCILWPEPQGIECDDGNPSTEGDVCNGQGSCGAGECPGRCDTDQDCENTSPSTQCTYYQCRSGFCVLHHRSSGTLCNDGNSDTENDQCDNVGECGGECKISVECAVAGDCGVPPQCQLYTCEAEQCVLHFHTPGTLCDDGNLQTLVDVCDAFGRCSGECDCPMHCVHDLDCGFPTECRSYQCVEGLCNTIFAPIQTPCDDGNPDTEGDYCDGSGHCLAGECPTQCVSRIDCGPEPQCSSFECVEGFCILTMHSPGTPCDDGNVVTTTEICDGQGNCGGGECPSYCVDMTDCPASTDCLSWMCVDHSCHPIFAPPWADCDDGNPDTTGETCDGQGHCKAGDCPEQCQTALDCDTIESISPICSRWTCVDNLCLLVHRPPGFPCEDGNPSTTGDQCDGQGNCEAGDCPYRCRFTWDCGVDTDCLKWDCVHSIGGGLCIPSFELPGTECGEGGVCDGQGTCEDDCPDQCEIPADCGPSTQCSTWICDAGICILLPELPGTPCDDNNPDSTGEVCDGQYECGGGTCDCSIQCETLADCGPTGLECVEHDCIQGQCQAVLSLPGTACDDDDYHSTNDECDTKGCCLGQPIDCDDQDPCTHDEYISGSPYGECIHTSYEGCASIIVVEWCNPECNFTQDCPEPPQCMTTYCDRVSNMCVLEVASDGTSCNDGNPCTSLDHCLSGICVGSSTNCDDQNSCTYDGCVPESGCVHEILDPCPCDEDPTYVWVVVIIAVIALGCGLLLCFRLLHPHKRHRHRHHHTR